jgi:hypothetical protein
MFHVKLKHYKNHHNPKQALTYDVLLAQCFASHRGTRAPLGAMNLSSRGRQAVNYNNNNNIYIYKSMRRNATVRERHTI